jgi:hypothetical protein
MFIQPLSWRLLPECGNRVGDELITVTGWYRTKRPSIAPTFVHCASPARILIIPDSSTSALRQ